MPTTPYHQQYIAVLPYGAERKVYQALCNHVGERNAISLRDLTKLAFGGAYTTTTERQCREAIRILRVEHHIPVMSHSGKPGRWLAADADEIAVSATELENRAYADLEAAKALRQAHIPAADPWEFKKQSVVQEVLF